MSENDSAARPPADLCSAEPRAGMSCQLSHFKASGQQAPLVPNAELTKHPHLRDIASDGSPHKDQSEALWPLKATAGFPLVSALVVVGAVG